MEIDFHRLYRLHRSGSRVTCDTRRRHQPRNIENVWHRGHPEDRDVWLANCILGWLMEGRALPTTHAPSISRKLALQ